MSTPVSTPVYTISVGGGIGAGVSSGGAGGGIVYGPVGTGEFSTYTNQSYKLTAERLEEWQWFQNFMDQNPDVKERFAVHKTYEILNND